MQRRLQVDFFRLLFFNWYFSSKYIGISLKVIYSSLCDTFSSLHNLRKLGNFQNICIKLCRNYSTFENLCCSWLKTANELSKPNERRYSSYTLAINRKRPRAALFFQNANEKYENTGNSAKTWNWLMLMLHHWVEQKGAKFRDVPERALLKP